MSKELEIAKILTISTTHITSETNDWLGSKENNCVVCYDKTDYGWFIFVNLDEDVVEVLINDEIPQDLRRCINFAYKNQCSWLCLDCDGDVVEELNEYDW